MENTSYALFIVVGTLIAVMIISIIVVRWRSIGEIEKTKDDTTAVKNRADFNAEYEAYNKSLMYGTDVLSCLNKAQNNNQKYVYNNYYGSDTQNFGAADREEYFIDVEVTLNSPLYDNIKAYYKDEKGKFQRCLLDPGADATVKGNYGDKLFNISSSNHFDIPQVDYYYFEQGKVIQDKRSYTDIMWKSSYTNQTLFNILTKGLGTGSNLGAGQIETNISAGTYGLLTSSDVSDRYKNTTANGKRETSYLAALITTVSLKTQKFENSPAPTDRTSNDWSYCEWTTAASDFKSRRFRCTGTEYNDNTGYVEKISFEEIKRN